MLLLVGSHDAIKLTEAHVIACRVWMVHSRRKTHSLWRWEAPYSSLRMCLRYSKLTIHFTRMQHRIAAMS
eukprot:4358893-Amphidinium_carterae.1